MKLKKITALFLAVLTCVSLLTGTVSADTKKSIKLNKTSISMAVGDSSTLTAAVTGYKKYTVVWSTSDKTVAAVSGGKVTAKKAGTATVTAKIKGTDLKASCKVTVKKKGTSGNGNSSASSKNAKEFVSKIKVGWNLGNSLDAIGGETAWGNPKTTKAMIDTVKKAGFNTLRIPITWGSHMDKDGKIDKAWLDRVQEVVDYAVANDMYIIINIHHDEYSVTDKSGWVRLTDDAEGKASLKKFKSLWKQVAERFKNYDEKLIFEGLNEPRTKGSAKEWIGGTPEERAVLNTYYEEFVKVVRGTGGNNKTRFLMIAPYAASKDPKAMNDLKVPKDDRVIIEVHGYMPYVAGFSGDMSQTKLTDAGKREIENSFKDIDKAFISKGYCVIMDECGVVNKGNEAERIKMMQYHIQTAKKYGIPCVIWDSNAFNKGEENFGLLNRRTLKWEFPDLVKAIVNAAK